MYTFLPNQRFMRLLESAFVSPGSYQGLQLVSWISQKYSVCPSWFAPIPGLGLSDCWRYAARSETSSAAAPSHCLRDVLLESFRLRSGDIFHCFCMAVS